jgi:hypothetical protein
MNNILDTWALSATPYERSRSVDKALGLCRQIVRVETALETDQANHSESYTLACDTFT